MASFRSPKTTSGPANKEAPVSEPHDEEDGDHIIAHLIPDSERAIRALSRARPAESDHRVYAVRLSHPHVDHTPSESPVWAYKIAASHLVTAGAGWKMGSGESKRGRRRIPLRGVEFLLCATGDKKAREHINDFHARVFLNKESGAWLLQNMSREPITYINGGGVSDVVLKSHRTAVLWMRQNRIRFGPYQFLFQFTGPSGDYDGAAHTKHETQYLDARNAFLSRSGIVVSPRLHPLPRETHRRADRYVLHESTISVSLNHSTRVQVGVDARTGEAVAVKQFTHNGTARARSNFITHILRMRDFSDNPTGILPLHRYWCEHSYLPCPISASECIYMATPLAVNDFANFDFSSISRKTLLQLCYGPLRGLATMHARSYMHRSIKPGHILILSLDPRSPSAVICDFGACVKASTHTSRDTGPPHTVAPEVWSATDENPYTQAIDVWSFGYVFLEALAQGKGIPGRDDEPQDIQGHIYDNHTDLKGLVTRGRHTAIMSFIDKTVDSTPHHAPTADDDIGDELKILLKAMLAWDPKDRISAEEALASPVWEDLVCEGRPEQPRDVVPERKLGASKRSRPEEGIGPTSGAMRKARRRKGVTAAPMATNSESLAPSVGVEDAAIEP